MSVQSDEDGSFPEDPNDVMELLLYEQELSDTPTVEGVEPERPADP